MDAINTLSETYAVHNQLHADYALAGIPSRRRDTMQRQHVNVVARIVKLQGHHVARNDALDSTLPSELQNELTLRAVSTIEIEDSTLASSTTSAPASVIQVLRTGTFHHPQYGKFTITPDDLERMFDNFVNHRPQSPTEMVVDYEHMSAAEPAQIAPAAGWVKELSLSNDKNRLYARVEWTTTAAKRITDKEYRFISPEFALRYKDKETNKDIGPTLISVALTNRPFLEGMSPVVLSKELQETFTFSETSNNDANLVFIEWTGEYIDELPDSAFAYVAPGEKDATGKTTPRSLRHLPYLDKQGNPDLPHLRNALARLDQTNLSPEAKSEARKKLEAAAKEAGVGEYNERNGQMDEAEVKALREKAEHADALSVELVDVKKALDDAIKTRDEALRTLLAKEAESVIDKAIVDKRLLPARREWALAYYLKDKTGFESYIKTADVVGPALDVRGTDDKKNETVALTEAELKIATSIAASLGKPADAYVTLLRESKKALVVG
jgi:phage I-like protein